MYCLAFNSRVLSFLWGRPSSAAEENGVTRILVVDDNPAVRRYLRTVLEQQHGWRVCDEARNGQEAVDRFQQIRPDVVVLDFQMPCMNGLDAARIISRLSPETPILMVTLYLTKQLSEEAQKVGAKVGSDYRDRVKGVSGEVRQVYSSKKATLSFGRFRQSNLGIITFDLSNVSSQTGTEVSGFLGFEMLERLELKLDYRDGLVDFAYDPKRVPLAR
jgi:CheY-like chemotaxis protein